MPEFIPQPIFETSALDDSLLEVRTALEGIKSRIASTRWMAAPFRTLFHGAMAERFNAEGPGWHPLAESTIARKAREGYGGEPMLVRTKMLRSSLTRTGAKYSYTKVTADGIEVGSKVPYGGFHQAGTSEMPARPLIDEPLADAVGTAMGALAAEWLSVPGLSSEMVAPLEVPPL